MEVRYLAEVIEQNIHMPGSSNDLVTAVVLWTGYKSTSLPTRNDESLAKVLDLKDGAKLMTIVKSLEEDFNRSNALQLTDDLVEMTEIASGL